MEIRREIERRLSGIEADHGVRVIYACESGSRAWGFPSANSDYDVRFIYAHPRDWYVTIRRPRDVIELPLEDDLDINGWDLRKTLFLLWKANPTLQEWLASPVVYRVEERALAPLTGLVAEAFSQAAACHHYLSMARLHIQRHFSGPRIRLKSYLYTIRPLLCCRWALESDTQPPVLFSELLAGLVPDGPVRAEIDRLLELKQRVDEVETMEQSTVLHGFCTGEFERLSRVVPAAREAPATHPFDAALGRILSLCWDDPR